MAETQEQREGVERGQTYLRIPFRGNVFRTAQPMIGLGTYIAVGNAILAQGLRVPTGEERAFELDRVYNSEVDEFRESREVAAVRQIMEDKWVWVFNKNIWMPKSARNPGIYVVFDEKVEGVSAPFDLTELEDRLSGGHTERGVRFSNDKVVRFAPRKTFSLGSQTGSLAQSGFAIANYDIEGAERLDRVVPKLNSGRPYICGASENVQPEQSVAALVRSWKEGFGFLLYGHGLSNGECYSGFASGVRKSDEVGAKN